MKVKAKQEYYKTAFSKVYDVFVSLEHAYQDCDGNWIFSCSSSYHDDSSRRFGNVLHRESELTRFCL